MNSRQISQFAFLLTLPCAVACSSDEEFSHPPFAKLEDVRTWATAGSAVSVYSNVYEVLAVADGQQQYTDPACPVIDDDGTTWTATGGCTDTGDVEWQGTATIVRDGDDRSLTLDGFQGDDGTFDVHQAEVDLHEFEAHLVLGGVTTIEYTGSVQGGYEGPTLWNGGGHVEREGVLAPNGEVDASTLDEVVDNAVCAGQPVSGLTRLASGDDEAVIRYDGESDCDEKQNAQLWVNGEDRGLIDGISCAVRAPGAGKSSWLLTGVALLALCATRRRRR